ncbi:MAG: glycosyltransferase family 2 protein [Pirellulaceae bacterium]|nr:glycosyltransferase family 2 protein [Pirellulaceae bacterium]
MSDLHSVCFQLSVVIPVYNEMRTIEPLLRQVRLALPKSQMIVVDDASKDGATEIILSLQEELGIEVVLSPCNGGKGSAVRLGLERAQREWVVIQDADLEYDPNEVVKLLKAAMAEPGSVVYGSRYLNRATNSNASRLNVLAVRLLAWWAAILYGRLLSDPHTCYKLLPTGLMQELNLQSCGFELCAEINGKLLRRRVQIVELPISYHARTAAEGKKIRWYDFFHAAWVYFRQRWQF